MHVYVNGTTDSVLYTEVSLFQGCPLRGVQFLADLASVPILATYSNPELIMKPFLIMECKYKINRAHALGCQHARSSAAQLYHIILYGVN